MSTTKTFVAITSGIYDNKLIYLTTSNGTSLFNEDGITSKQALEFLHNLVHLRDNKTGVVFVCYAFARDNEFLFSDLSTSLKDKLFIAYPIKQHIETVESELERLDELFYHVDADSEDYQQLQFERSVNHLFLQELTEVKYEGFKIELRNGKILTINYKGRSLNLYDIFGFFKPNSLRQAVSNWLNKDVCLLDRKHFFEFNNFRESELDGIRAYASFEAKYIAKLATKFNDKLLNVGVRLSRYHGIAAVSANYLTKWKATKQYHGYKYRRQLSNELYRACYSAMYGGRAEQFKLGTIKDVYVYDINSAYGFACTSLPVMLSKPIFTRQYKNEPFSLWYCEYDFTVRDAYIGLLPNRNVNGFTQYKLKGSGYFYQPEIAFVLEHYPECVNIRHGYYVPYVRADFAKEIEEVYNLRLELKAKGHPLEKVIKLALASIYGKFAQYHGQSRFYNPFYAGYITSVTRSELLNASKGNEESIICYQTDAIHSRKPLPLRLSDDIGGYKLNRYESVTYLDNGVYRATDYSGRSKTKTRGFRSFNFAKALAELRDKRTYSALAEFFVGHNLFMQNMFTGAGYLEQYSSVKTIEPMPTRRSDSGSAMRLFNVSGIDLSEGFIDSKPISSHSGVDSYPYRQPDFTQKDLALDTFLAERA